AAGATEEPVPRLEDAVDDAAAADGSEGADVADLARLRDAVLDVGAVLLGRQRLGDDGIHEEPQDFSPKPGTGQDPCCTRRPETTVPASRTAASDSGGTSNRSRPKSVRSASKPVRMTPRRVSACAANAAPHVNARSASSSESRCPAI